MQIFLDETSSWKHGELINFDKVRNIGAQIKVFSAGMTYGKFLVTFLVQKKAFSYQEIFQKDQKMQDYLLSAEIWGESEFLKLSRLREDADKNK